MSDAAAVVGNKVSGRVLGLALCDALGISPNGIREITVSAEATEMAMVTIRMFVPDRVCDILRRYELCERGNDDE